METWRTASIFDHILNLEKLNDLLNSEFLAADGTDFVLKRSQTFEAGAMAAVKDALPSLDIVVLFLANVAFIALWLRFF